jgi:hypothetical protein
MLLVVKRRQSLQSSVPRLRLGTRGMLLVVKRRQSLQSSVPRLRLGTRGYPPLTEGEK